MYKLDYHGSPVTIVTALYCILLLVHLKQLVTFLSPLVATNRPSSKWLLNLLLLTQKMNMLTAGFMIVGWIVNIGVSAVQYQVGAVGKKFSIR